MKFWRLKDLRTYHDLSQAHVARAIGVSQQAYATYELGTRAIPVEKLIALADFYHVSLDFIIDRHAPTTDWKKHHIE